MEQAKERSSGILFGIGNPLLDILAKVAPGYVKKWNLELNSQINAEAEHDGLFDEVVNYFDVEYVPGGCTLNTVRVCQWMSGLENSTIFSGAIGNDRFGEILNRNIQRQRVRTRLFKVDNDCTGRAVSLITKGGNRSIVGLIAAANRFTESNLDSIWEHQVAQSDFFYQSSWFLLSDSGLQIYKRLGQFAAENEKHFGLNLSAPTLCQNHLDKILQIYPYRNDTLS
jgi:adenosine kinase